MLARFGRYFVLIAVLPLLSCGVLICDPKPQTLKFKDGSQWAFIESTAIREYNCCDDMRPPITEAQDVSVAVDRTAETVTFTYQYEGSEIVEVWQIAKATLFRNRPDTCEE